MSRKLNPRERVMLYVVGGIVAFFILSLLISGFRKNYASLTEEVATRRQELTSLRTLLNDAPLWQEREVWLEAKQPRLTQADTAAVELLEEVRRVARIHGILLEQPEIAASSEETSHHAVKIAVKTRGDWAALIAFLNELQQPEHFIVFEEATLRIDPSDATKMQGDLRIAKWYAAAE